LMCITFYKSFCQRGLTCRQAAYTNSPVDVILVVVVQNLKAHFRVLKLLKEMTY